MPFLLAEILNFQGSTHLIGVGSLSNKLKMVKRTMYGRCSCQLLEAKLMYRPNV